MKYLIVIPIIFLSCTAIIDHELQSQLNDCRLESMELWRDRVELFEKIEYLDAKIKLLNSKIGAASSLNSTLIDSIGMLKEELNKYQLQSFPSDETSHTSDVGDYG